jgi:hypothetical protein
MKMNKSLLVAALVVAAGLFVARPSSAQLVASGDLGTLNSSNQLEGTFSVLAAQQSPGSLTWNVTVAWVSNGPAAPTGGAFLDDISMRLNSGGTVTAGQISGGVNQLIDSTTGGVNGINWVQQDSLPLRISNMSDPGTNAGDASPTAPVDGLNGGLDFFSGTITLDGSSGPITAINFDISNTGSGEEWFGTELTPEGSSLALLLPGLIPLGLILKRKRRI